MARKRTTNMIHCHQKGTEFICMKTWGFLLGSLYCAPGARAQKAVLIDSILVCMICGNILSLSLQILCLVLFRHWNRHFFPFFGLITSWIISFNSTIEHFTLSFVLLWELLSEVIGMLSLVGYIQGMCVSELGCRVREDWQGSRVRNLNTNINYLKLQIAV